mmetsp:Transcript_21225/g.36693  ORF Transcript_21225/g.36693 Transcript_21225/m.36693 type:complete len:106 (+) Transcript_21225:86-403(+)
MPPNTSPSSGASISMNFLARLALMTRLRLWRQPSSSTGAQSTKASRVEGIGECDGNEASSKAAANDDADGELAEESNSATAEGESAVPTSIITHERVGPEPAVQL